MTITRHSVVWAVGALLGLALAVALTWTASRLAGEHIGLSSAPPSVVSTLAPQPSRFPASRSGAPPASASWHRPEATSSPPAATTAAPLTTTAAPPATAAAPPVTTAAAPSATTPRPTRSRDDAGDGARPGGPPSGPDD